MYNRRFVGLGMIFFAFFYDFFITKPAMNGECMKDNFKEKSQEEKEMMK